MHKKKWQEKIAQSISQLQQPVKQKEDSFLSSPDCKELPPHMSSTPKSESVLAAHVEQTVHPMQKIEHLLDEEIQLQHQSARPREPQPASHENDYYMDKLFMKNLPPTSSWMTFSGEGEYDHMEFIDWVDRLKADFHMKDAL